MNRNSDMKLFYRKNDILRGALIYCIGDTIAALILNEFTILRMAGIVFIGATLYAFEIPNYFAWIEKKVPESKTFIDSINRTLLALLYFNPLWIARHLLFINLLKGNFNELSLSLISIGFYSFLVNIPFSIMMNYIIQNKISLKWRFVASASFSSMMAIYYAFSEVIFK